MHRLKKIIQTVRGILREDPNEPQNNEDQKISKHENSRHTRNCLNANIFLQTVKRIEYTVQRFVKLFCVLDKACTVFFFSRIVYRACDIRTSCHIAVVMCNLKITATALF